MPKETDKGFVTNQQKGAFMLNRMKVIVIAAICALLAGASVAGAQQAGLIGSSDIANNTVHSVDVKNGTLKKRDLNKKLYDRLLNDDAPTDEDNVTVNAPKGDKGDAGTQGVKGDTGPTGPQGAQGAPGVANLESDGPYPGATELVEGDNSTDYWDNDGTLQRSWVQCPDGKVALGGGFTLAADASLADKLATTVLTSAPVQVEGGNPDTYSPIAGDPDGSFVPNGWLIEGVTNSGNPALIVRPHVICANVG